MLAAGPPPATKPPPLLPLLPLLRSTVSRQPLPCPAALPFATTGDVAALLPAAVLLLLLLLVMAAMAAAAAVVSFLAAVCARELPLVTLLPAVKNIEKLELPGVEPATEPAAG
jgi:uncharacterized integral membrane protein